MDHFSYNIIILWDNKHILGYSVSEKGNEMACFILRILFSKVVEKCILGNRVISFRPGDHQCTSFLDCGPNFAGPCDCPPDPADPSQCDEGLCLN